MALDITSYEIGKKSAGGSGTTDYTELSNKPSINDVTLTGNKTSSDLKLQGEIDSNNKLNADLVDDTSSTNKFVTSAEKTTWSGKQDELTFDSTPTENSTNPVTSDGIFQALAGAGGGGSVGTVVKPVPTKFVIKNYDVGIYYFFDQPSNFDVAYNPQNVYQTIRISGRPHMAVIFKKFSDISELEVGEVFAYVLYSSSNNINFKVFARGSYDTSSYTAFDFSSYNFASTTRSNNFTGTNTFNSHLPTSTLTPTQDTELVPKSYVDAQIQALRNELSGE